MAIGETFNLGQIISTAEGIKSQQRSAIEDELRRKYLGVQIANAEQAGRFATAQENRAAQQFSLEQQLNNTKMLNMAAAEVARNPGSAGRWLPQLQQAGILGDFDWQQMDPNQLQMAASEIYESTSAALNSQNQVDPSITARKDSEIEILRERARLDAEAQQKQAGFQSQSAVQRFNQEMKLLEKRAEIELAGSGQGNQSEIAQKNQALQQTWRTYVAARDGLVSSLNSTVTGPFLGRGGDTTAITEDQQTAEGAIAAMAPVLKQIFRIAGEGTFTDKDQELLLRMVPTRKDKAGARVRKLKNIDRIIKSKLGLDAAGASGSWTSGATGSWSVERL
ncbi:MAG: hypothetical protein ACKO0Z_24555 [Betaproteobacteria bacterium]